MERRRAAVRPGHHLRAVVAGVHDDGVVRDAEVVELLEQLADLAVVLDHAVRIEAQAGFALGLLLQARPDVHARGIPPDEKRLVGLVSLVDELKRPLGDLLVDRLHPPFGERAGVLDFLLADLAVMRIDGRIVHVRGPGMKHAARPEFTLELGQLRIVGVLRLLLRVEVVEVPEKLVEAMHRGHELVAIAQVVLAELAHGVAVRLEQLGDGRVLRPQAERRARQADLGEAGADGRLAGDERRAPGGAALLAVPVGEQAAFLGDAVDVRCLVAHDAVVVAAGVVPADVVAPNDENVRLLADGGRLVGDGLVVSRQRKQLVPMHAGHAAAETRSGFGRFVGRRRPGWVRRLGEPVRGQAARGRRVPQQGAERDQGAGLQFRLCRHYGSSM